MNKRIYTAALSAILIAGCSKEKLNLYPYNQVATEQAFRSETDVTFDINGMYNGLRTSTSYFVNGIWNILGDVLSDNLVLNTLGRQSLKNPYYEYRYSATNTYGLFGSGYSIIRRANAILENIEKFPNGTFKNNAKGEALAVRALVYFDMSRVYSKTYLNASDADFTVPYVTTTDATITPANEPVKGFYDKVIADLTQAETLINANNSISASNTVSRLNKAAVAGLLSRVYLYKGDYSNCIAAANRALGTTPNVGSLTTFGSIWTDATDAGVLFKVKNTNLDNLNAQGVNYYQTVSQGIKSEYNVDYNFYQLFANNDIRKTIYIQTSPYSAVNYNHVIKYAGRPGTPVGVVDAKVLRTAEVLLSRAEAYYRSNNVAGAVADLVLLKSNRYTGYVAATDNALSGTALLNEILLQRRLELAFEGDRFWDLKRLNLPVQRANKGDKADGTGTAPLFTTLAAGDFKFNLPYEQTELNFNKNLKQNPGY
ncbi:RagB/SusD family nutrient uptake outer membrane protein [Mucilaginibacter galii]|uniref:Membrane protein n=1 Tax=Mucilaginibacter galii TaxID=2005073 RepID=A0A917N400_9SPHI|nr:RagB/SusD family nutrient uptake outer membrane protein [Mucilaginibacter galii]GGI51547.1 membrane protein [Mucilaginibacter galii]